MPRTARPLKGSSAGFHGARVKVSCRRSTAILPVGVDDGVVVHAGNLRTWFRLDVRGVEMPREVARQALGFGLAKSPHHFGHW